MAGQMLWRASGLPIEAARCATGSAPPMPPEAADQIAAVDVLAELRHRQLEALRLDHRVAQDADTVNLHFNLVGGNVGNLAVQAVAGQAGIDEIARQNQQPLFGLDQVVDEIGMSANRLVGRQRPGRRCPDDGVSRVFDANPEDLTQAIDVGDKVQVRLAAVDVAKGFIDFERS